MDNQKDIEKTKQNSNGHQNKRPTVKAELEYLHKKTEKLVTALYMVTDVMEDGDALKNKMRSLSVDLLSDVYTLHDLTPTNKQSRIELATNHIKELISLVDIAGTIGFISAMNAGIIKRELIHTGKELEEKNKDNNSYTHALDERLFDIPNPEEHRIQTPIGHNNWVKRTLPLSYTNSSKNSLSVLKKTMHHASDPLEKKDRIEKILSLIKSKDNGQGVSIKDIAIDFSDYSEKTIQRELNAMVEKGQLKKNGSKRWSKYLLSS
jgi:hypothetical protein